MPENAQIDDDLFDKINEAMLIRLKDKVPNVRIQAVLALSRLQDPKDDECPVVNGVYSSLNPFSVSLIMLNSQQMNFLIMMLWKSIVHIYVHIYNMILKLILRKILYSSSHHPT